MNKTFLQTTDWLKFQELIGHKTWQFPSAGSGQVDSGAIRANIIQHKISFGWLKTSLFGKNYLYVPHGPEIFFANISVGLKNEVDNFLKYLRNLAKENGSVFVKIEPVSDIVVEAMFRKGIKRSEKQIQPYRTVVIDLNLPEEKLLSNMHHKTRYNIKIADKHGIKLESGGDIDMFLKLLDKTSKRDKFYAHTKDYYKKLLEHFNGQRGLKTDLFLAYQEDRPVAGAIVLQYGGTGYYLHGASDYEFRSMMAPYALHWNIITCLKEKGLNYYDLWGIDAQKWPGVTRFKLSWGGETKEYPGSFDMPISKFWYFLYNFARRIR